VGIYDRLFGDGEGLALAGFLAATGGGALRPGDGRSWAKAGDMAWVLKQLEGLTRTRTTDPWEADGDSCFAWEIRKILA
jgi:hypothetical protein